MTDAITASILTRLRGDAQLQTLLGGPGRIQYGSLSQHELIPGLYLTGGNVGTSTLSLGYRQTGRRDETDTVQIDAWATIPELAGDLIRRVVPVMLGGVPGLRNLNKIGEMKPDRDPDRSELWHANSRFEFEYTIKDQV